MKIAFVHPALMDYRLKLFEELNGRYDLTFIFTSQGRGQEGGKEDHLKIPPGWDCRMVRSDKLTIRGCPIVTYLKLMIELLSGNYDVILTSTKWYICFPIARITGKKFILWTENWRWTSNSFTRRLLDLFTIFIAKHAEAVIATGTKSYEAHLNLGVNSEKIFTHPQCAVDYSEIPAKDLGKELRLENKRIILYVGRIVQVKGVDYLIRAFALLEKELDNVTLILMGDGPFRKEYENLTEKLGVKSIIFTGYSEDKAFYYKACDVFVLPSTSDCWGLVINEAMAFGKPIITTDAVGAVKDMVKGGYNGYVVKNKNVQELYGALYKILNTPKLMEEMGKNSRKIFEEKNDYERMIDKFIKVIEYVKRG